MTTENRTDNPDMSEPPDGDLDALSVLFSAAVSTPNKIDYFERRYHSDGTFDVVDTRNDNIVARVKGEWTVEWADEQPVDVQIAGRNDLGLTPAVVNRRKSQGNPRGRGSWLNLRGPSEGSWKGRQGAGSRAKLNSVRGAA